MTTRQLKDSNWASARKSIISKYNKNGDGNFDQSEVDGIIDDYMGTIYNHQSLQGANKSQRKLIIFGAIMIVLLTFSNLGTGIAAANISKEIKIIDGKMTAADNGGGIQTETSLRRFDVPGVVRKEIASARRGLQSYVLCSTQPPENFCDCEDDCTNEPEWCSCDEAQKCCEGATPTVLCPGQPIANYCDCTGDCLNQPAWCSCEEAQLCCDANVVGSAFSPGSSLFEKLAKLILPFGE